MSSHTTQSPPLEPPGAGLPACELAWLRMLFRLACRLISKPLGLRWFTSEARKIVALANGVSAARGTVPVLIDRITGIEDSSRYWSIFMVLDHVRIVDEGITLIVRTLTSGHLFRQEIRIQDVKPTLASGPETIARLLSTVGTYESTITQLGTLGRITRHAHPWFGPMTAHDWHCLAAVHHWVHRRQLERIVGALSSEVRTER
ncbi:MAG: DinB family protein [Nitrospira sp.]|nr:DinB family protein [Nitrospira sp.]